MTTTNINIPGARLALLLTFLLAALCGVGCGDSNNNPDPDQGVDLGGEDQGTEDIGTEDIGTDIGLPDEGCFRGTPDTELELLNQCPLTGCAPFDNETRLPLLGENGELPALP